MGITSKNYNGLQKAYAFLNMRLFDFALPEVLITLQRDGKAYGYFWAKQFSHRHELTDIDEIAMNPDGFVGRSDEAIISTLAHEMCHVWQQHYGKPSRNGYHNHEWAEKMLEIGLLPTSDGTPEGKQTGQRMTHIIIPDGAFQKAFKRLVSQRAWRLDWQANPPKAAIGGVSIVGTDSEGDDGGGTSTSKKGISKVKYTCPVCKQNAWAKPSALLLCGVCYSETEDITSMLEAD